MATQTRYSQWPAWAARLLLAALVLPSLLALAQSRSAAGAEAPAPPPFSDIKLYRAITRAVAQGSDYYAAAAAAHRAHRYPVWPPQVIREPAEAMVLAALRWDGLRWAALIALAAAALELLRRGLARANLSPRERLWSLVLSTGGVASVCTPGAAYMHEVWAGLLILMSLSLRRPDRWLPAAGLGLLACLVRELALPYLLVMAACAAFDRRRGETLGWVAATLAFCGAYGLHLHLSAVQHRAGDLVSPGWLSFGGLRFLIAAARNNALYVFAPRWAIAAGLSLSLLAFLGRMDGLVMRCGLTLLAFCALFAVVGRPDNDYWGLLYAPLASLGLALAPKALADVAARALGARRALWTSWQALTSSRS